MVPHLYNLGLWTLHTNLEGSGAFHCFDIFEVPSRLHSVVQLVENMQLDLGCIKALVCYPIALELINVRGKVA
jgi:hypothetical protein